MTDHPKTFAETAAASAERDRARQEKTEPDPLDEDNHSDRFDRYGDRIVRVDTSGHAYCQWEHSYSLEDWNTPYGPLTFAPNAIRKDS